MRAKTTEPGKLKDSVAQGLLLCNRMFLKTTFLTGDKVTDFTSTTSDTYTEDEVRSERAARTGTPIEEALSKEDRAKIGSKKIGIANTGGVDGPTWTEDDVRVDRAMAFLIPVETELSVDDLDRVGKPKTNADRQRLAEARAKIIKPDPIKDQYVDSPPEAGLVVSRTQTAGPNIDMTTSWAPPAPLKGREDEVYVPKAAGDIEVGKTRLSHAESGDHLQ